MAISADGRLLYANKHYVRIHGLDEDWSHYTIYDLPISFNTPIAFLRKIVEIKNAPGGVLTYTCEYRNEYEKKNGILKVSAVILEHEGEDTMWFFGMDVTDPATAAVLPEKADEIELVGLVSNICVVSNAVVLQSKYPEATIIVDAACTDSFDKALHEKVLDVLAGFQVKIIGR